MGKNKPVFPKLGNAKRRKIKVQMTIDPKDREKYVNTVGKHTRCKKKDARLMGDFAAIVGDQTISLPFACQQKESAQHGENSTTRET